MNEPRQNPKLLTVTAAPESVRQFLLTQIRDLKERGWDVHVATGPGCDLPELRSENVPHHWMPLTRHISPMSDLRSLIRLYQLCRRWRFDIVHTHMIKGSLLGQLAAWMARVPVRVETAHGTRYSRDLPLWLRAGILLAEGVAARRAQRVWVLNNEDYQLFRRWKLARPDALRLLGSGGIGVDLNRFRPDILNSQGRILYRKKLNLPAESLVVGFIGRPVRDKGIEELRIAWPAIVRSCPNAWLLVVTAELDSERTSEKVNTESFEGLTQANVLVNRRDMPEIYNCLNLVVLPSYREGFSRVILEASACGIPVVASDVRGCRDAVVHGNTGEIVPPRDSDALAQAVVQLLQEEELRAKMRSQAREHACRYFDEELVCAHVYETYMDLMAGRR